MILRDDIPFDMSLIKRGLMALRERTETSYYVHDMRTSFSGNALLQMRAVLASGNRIAHFQVQRSIEVNDGDIITLRSKDGQVMNYYVFDVERNRFAKDKFTMHAILWSLPVTGYGLCGKTAFDDLHGRRNIWLEERPYAQAV